MRFFFVLTLFSLSSSESQVRPSDGPDRSDCGTKLTQHSDTMLGYYDFWNNKGNEDLLKALNAALKETNNEWSGIATGIGSEHLPMTGTHTWPTWSDDDNLNRNDTFGMILKTGKIRFGSTFTLPPLGSVDTGRDCFMGKEIKLGNMIAEAFSEKYKKEIVAEWVQLGKSGDFWFDISFALSGSSDFVLEKPDIDVILSSVTNTESRRNGGKARFSLPYIIQKYAVLVSKKGQDAGITTKADLNNEAYSVSVTGGATNEKFATDKYPKCPRVVTKTFGERMEKVKNGTAHFGLGDAVTVKYYQQTECPECTVIDGIGDSSFPLAMAVRPSRRPGGARPKQTCKIVTATSTANKANCYRKARSSTCSECSWGDKDCYDALRNQKEGSCCLDEYCCKETSKRRSTSGSGSSRWSNSRCSRSVEKRGYITCDNSYSISITAEATDIDTQRKVTDKSIRYNCHTKKFCRDNLIKKQGQTVNCSISLDGQSITLEIEDPLSVASHHSISLLPLMILMVWFLIR